MTKTRLNKSHKQRMLEFALSNIKEVSNLEKKYADITNETEKLIQVELLKQLPLADKKILNKYNCLSFYSYINVKIEENSSNLEQFHAIKSNTFEIPKNSSRLTVYWLGSKVGNAVINWAKVKKEIDTDIKTIRQDISEVLAISTTFEDAVTLWPKFEEIRKEICIKSTSLTILDKSTLQRIKQYKV